jgi:PilZ domain
LDWDLHEPQHAEHTKVDLSERRRTRRLPAGENQATLEWAEGPDFLDTPARLIDISQGGASFVAERPPPTDRDVWFRLEVPRLTGRISARVVRLDGLMVGGLSFSGYCPHDLISGLT